MHVRGFLEAIGVYATEEFGLELHVVKIVYDLVGCHPNFKSAFQSFSLQKLKRTWSSLLSMSGSPRLIAALEAELAGSLVALPSATAIEASGGVAALEGHGKQKHDGNSAAVPSRIVMLILIHEPLFGLGLYGRN